MFTMKFFRVLFWALTTLSLGACQSLFSLQSRPELPLLAPTLLNQHLQVTQSVKLESSGKKGTTVLAAWAVTPNEINLAGLSPAGQTLFLLRYDGHNLEENYSSVLTPDAIPGKDILAQLQLTYWPINTIEKSFENTPWEIYSDKQSRQIYYNNTKALEIQIIQDTNDIQKVVIYHHLYNYTVTINTLNVSRSVKELQP